MDISTIARRIKLNNSLHIIMFGTILGLLFGVIDVVVDINFYNDHTFWEQSFSPPPQEIWMRSVVLFLFILFSIIISYFVTKRNTERTRSERIISETLQEKEVFIKEIHHRVKNNLSVIQSLLSLQCSYGVDDKSRDTLIECGNRVRSMAMLHEMLYTSSSSSSINSSEYIHNFITKLFQVYNVNKDTIKLTIDVPKVFLDVETMIPVGLIVNELVTNALKYAFPENREGELFVVLSQDGFDKFTLTVKDNGIGLPADFDAMRSSNTLGMKIVIALIDQINGTLEIIKNDGTEFRISFKEEPIQ